MLFNGRALIFTFSGTQVRIAEIERLQSLFKMSMTCILEIIRVVDAECERQFWTQVNATTWYCHGIA